MAFGVASGLPGVASPDQVFPAPTAGVAMVAAAAAALALTPAASSHLKVLDVCGVFVRVFYMCVCVCVCRCLIRTTTRRGLR